MRSRLLNAVLASTFAAACTPPDPRAHFELLEVETYWAVDAPRGDTQYIAPVVRFRLRNKSGKPVRAVDAQAGFRRVGEEDQEWGSAWAVVATSRKPVAPGAEVFVELKSEGRYTMRQTPPEDMLKNDGFRDAKADVFLREGSSSWTKMTEVAVDRRIGSRSAVIPTVPVPAER
jgi:hypothetical protein